MVVWDLGGQQSLRQIWKNYYSSADVVFFVVDVSNDATVPLAMEVYEEVKGELHDTPVLLVGTKSDKSTNPQVEVDVKCSGTTGEGLSDLMERAYSNF